MQADDDRRLVSIDLLKRLEAEYGGDPIEGRLAPEHLGVAYELVAQVDEAARWYDVAIERQTDANVLGQAPFRLAELVLRAELADRYPGTLALLRREPFPWGGMNWHKFERAKLIAFLADRLGMRADATSAAKEALKLAAEGAKPQFPRHPTVGIVEADETTLSQLRALAALD